LFLNGKSLGRKIKTPGKDFRLEWTEVKYTPGELKVICYKNEKQWATDVVKTTSEATTLTLSADRSSIDADGNDLCFITVKVTDKAGLTVPRSLPLIHFSIEGPGEIVATDNGDATSFVPFQSKERPAFNGMALVIVKAKKGQKGNFVVKADSEGLSGGNVNVVVK
jgi:beta-galactosidase